VHELLEIIRLENQARRQGRRSALATVVRTRGSSYRRAGARMLVVEDGETIGSVSGGCLERDVVRRALASLMREKAELVTYDTADDDHVGVGCRGEVTVLVEPFPAESLATIESWLARRESGVVATIVGTRTTHRLGTRLLLDERGDVTGDLVDPAILNEMREVSRTAIRWCGAAEVWFEVIKPSPRLVIFGAGHDAEPLAALAKGLGWHVSVVDVAASTRTRERFAAADLVIVAGPAQACARMAFDETVSAVVMTHNLRRDRELLELLIPSKIGYLGLLGPRMRAEEILAEIQASGLPLTGLDRLHAPVGLDIGADTPAEVALSILAEIRAFHAGRVGGHLRDRSEPIHAREVCDAAQPACHLDSTG
jgi:xanthine/CO dehydrogenase XdhC/CoxF family maturation factor